MAYEWENSTLEQKKAKLQELQAKLSQAKMDSEYKQQRGGLTRAAEAMMPYDPTGAFNLLDKREALDVKRLQAEGKQSSDDVRIKLVSAWNTLNNRIAQAGSDDPGLDGMRNLSKRMQAEVASNTPSLQNAFSLLGEAETVLVPPPAGGQSPPPITTQSGSSVNAATKQVLRGGKVSSVATDWYTRSPVDGYNKPILVEGVDIANAPDNVKEEYRKELESWNKNNSSAKAAGAAAGAKTKGAEIAKRYYNKSSDAAKALGGMATQLTSFIDKYNNKRYDLINFADLKNSMNDGRMTDSDVGLALGLDAAEGAWQNALSYVTGGKAGIAKLKDPATARTALNQIIDAYNLAYRNITNPPFSGPYKEQARKAWVDQSYSTDFSGLHAPFTKVSGNNADENAGNPLLKDGNQAPSVKDFFNKK